MTEAQETWETKLRADLHTSPTQLLANLCARLPMSTQPPMGETGSRDFGGPLHLDAYQYGLRR